MLPLESFYKNWKRQGALLRGLRSYLLPDSYLKESDTHCLEFMALQEINPNTKLSKKIANALKLPFANFPINVGIRAGRLSWPPFLEDGLSSFWKGPLNDWKIEKVFLSGTGNDWEIGPFKFPVSTQFEERRGALILKGTWNKRNFVFVNLHLHAGSPSKGASLRRAKEIDLLLSKLEAHFDTADAIFLLGDFNCEHGSSELSPLQAAGFKEFLTAQGEPVDTWDARFNPITQLTMSHTKDQSWLEMDSKPRQIDHIFYKIKGKAWGKKHNSQAPWTIKLYRVFDGPGFGSWISDHFGLLVDISWTESH